MDDLTVQSVANAVEQPAGGAANTALIVCGALAREVIAMRDKHTVRPASYGALEGRLLALMESS